MVFLRPGGARAPPGYAYGYNQAAMPFTNAEKNSTAPTPVINSFSVNYALALSHRAGASPNDAQPTRNTLVIKGPPRTFCFNEHASLLSPLLSVHPCLTLKAQNC